MTISSNSCFLINSRSITYYYVSNCGAYFYKLYLLFSFNTCGLSMITNLFSIFDPVGSCCYLGVGVVWLTLSVLLISRGLILPRGRVAVLFSVYYYLKSEIDSLLGSYFYARPLLIRVFTLTFLFNSIGLVPYALTITSFIPLNIRVALRLWAGEWDGLLTLNYRVRYSLLI